MNKIELREYIRKLLLNELKIIHENKQLPNFVYHSTDIQNAIEILKHGYILPYENKLINNKLNPEDWYDDPEYGKFVYTSPFIHNDSNYYGLSDLDVTFKIDISNINCPIIYNDESYEGGTIAIKCKIPLKYINEIIIHNKDNELINLIKNKKIKYSFK